MQTKITQRGPLLNADGSLAQRGWANELLLEYSPKAVRANHIRIKEWDYYIMVSDDGFALSLCIADNRYMGLVNACLFDFNTGAKGDWLISLAFPLGRLHLPADSAKGDIVFENKNCVFKFLHQNGGRRLTCTYNLRGDHFHADVFLEQPPMDTMVIATPWQEDKKAFYYNQKINCMPARGYCKWGRKTYRFYPERDYGTLDWGRGVWTYDNTWYWGSGNQKIDGHDFGYNIGYGFGDTAAASENMIFYDGKCHKLEHVQFIIPEDDIMKPWRFTESNKRFEMDFEPLYNNRTDLNAGIAMQDAHQVFGRMNGTAVLDNGSAVQVKNLLCFAERVHNKY